MSVTTSQPNTLGSALALIDRARGLLERVPLSVPQLLTRVAIANVFWRSGMTKLANWDQTVQLFRDEYHVPVLSPEIAATLGATFELSCPVLLVLGLATRLGALPLLGMTAVIQTFVYPQNWPEHLTWAAMLVFLVVRGGGTYSLDHVLGGFFKRFRSL
jgi:putative oxidoreductase